MYLNSNEYLEFSMQDLEKLVNFKTHLSNKITKENLSAKDKILLENELLKVDEVIKKQVFKTLKLALTLELKA